MLFSNFSLFSSKDEMFPWICSHRKKKISPAIPRVVKQAAYRNKPKPVQIREEYFHWLDWLTILGRAGSLWWHLKTKLTNSQPSPEPFNKGSNSFMMEVVQIRSCNSYYNSHQGRTVRVCYVHPLYMTIIQNKGYSPTAAIRISACRIFSISSMCNAKIQEKETKQNIRWWKQASPDLYKLFNSPRQFSYNCRVLPHTKLVNTLYSTLVACWKEKVHKHAKFLSIESPHWTPSLASRNSPAQKNLSCSFLKSWLQLMKHRKIICWTKMQEERAPHKWLCL